MPRWQVDQRRHWRQLACGLRWYVMPSFASRPAVVPADARPVLISAPARSWLCKPGCPVNQFNNGGGANCANCAAGSDTQSQTGATSCTCTRCASRATFAVTSAPTLMTLFFSLNFPACLAGTAAASGGTCTGKSNNQSGQALNPVARSRALVHDALFTSFVGCMYSLQRGHLQRSWRVYLHGMPGQLHQRVRRVDMHVQLWLPDVGLWRIPCLHPYVTSEKCGSAHRAH